MKRVSFSFAFVITALFAALGLSGCSGDAGAQKQSSSAALAKPTPEESFELIAATFRRGVEDIPIGFVARRGGGHSMMSGRNEVSHELIPPSKEGDSYRGIITVDSEWKYSVQQSTEQPAQSEPEDSTSDESSALDDGQDPSGLEILDSELVGSSGTPAESRRPSGEQTVVTRRPEEEVVRKYELLYENGRWALVTKLDPDTERSIENAFNKALKTQI